MSNFAFGTYRITDTNPTHIQALKEAIESGIKLIDTSTNYMDGASERAIAVVLNSFGDEKRNSVEIVSKYGYIQGETMHRHKEKNFEGVVEFSEVCYHSIAPSFMRDQLEQSLERLQRSHIDCYLIHNPEYFIYDALNKNAHRDEMLDTMYERIYEAFVALEEEVQKGRIGSYGISSNAFAKPQNDPEFLPYEDLIVLADKASEAAGNQTHSFTTIEVPINILEQEGLKCASWAKKHGLRVLSNRPLNAQKNNQMYRLGEYEQSHEYYHQLNELLEICDNDTLRSVYNLLEQLDENKHKFGWIGDFDTFLYAEILPHIKKSLEQLEVEYLETMLEYIDRFFIHYRQMVAYECAQKTKKELKQEFEGCSMKLQECALKFLLEQEVIDFVLVGMRKPTYIYEALALVD